MKMLKSVSFLFHHGCHFWHLSLLDSKTSYLIHKGFIFGLKVFKEVLKPWHMLESQAAKAK